MHVHYSRPLMVCYKQVPMMAVSNTKERARTDRLDSVCSCDACVAQGKGRARVRQPAVAAKRVCHSSQLCSTYIHEGIPSRTPKKLQTNFTTRRVWETEWAWDNTPASPARLRHARPCIVGHGCAGPPWCRRCREGGSLCTTSTCPAKGSPRRVLSSSTPRPCRDGAG
jgi:hypothetical protein